MKIKIVTATMFLLGITATAYANPVTLDPESFVLGGVRATYPSILQVKKGETLKVDEAYSTVALKKGVRKGVRNVYIQKDIELS